MSQWTKADYEAQWISALTAIVGGRSKSALITVFQPPESTHWDWWPMYREGEVVVFQNQLLLFEDMPRGFTVEYALNKIGPIERYSEGQRISEWRTDVESIRKFLSR
jgi:hypothetical protein